MPRKTAAFAVSVLLVGFRGQAKAELGPWVIANYVNGICKEQTADCSNYLIGVREGLAFSKKWKVCFLKADSEQLRLAFRLYFSMHPEEITAPAAQVAAEAFTEQLKCPAS